MQRMFTSKVIVKYFSWWCCKTFSKTVPEISIAQNDIVILTTNSLLDRHQHTLWCILIRNV